MDWIVNFATSHQQIAYGVALGFVIAHPGMFASLAFAAFVKLPGVGQWIAAHPAQAKAWADGFDAQIDACIDKYAAAQTQDPAAKPK